MVRKKRQPRRKINSSNSYSSKFFGVFSRLLFWMIALVFILGLLGMGIFSYKMSHIDFNFLPRVNFILKHPDNSLSLLMYDVNKKTLTNLEIKKDIKIPVVYGYGHYRLGVLDDLSRQEGYGVELMRDSVSHWLGINFSGVISTKNTSFTYKNLQTYLKSNSDLGLWEKAWIWNQLRQIPDSRVKTIDLLSTYIPEATDTFERDYGSNGMLELSKDLLNYQELLLSNNQLVIVNATKISGLATFASKLLKNLGYDIVGVEDTNEISQTTKLLVDSSITLDVTYHNPLKELFFDLEAQTQENVFSQYRGDVVLILGTDYVELLYGK